jgi:hypothetical protein
MEGDPEAAGLVLGASRRSGAERGAFHEECRALGRATIGTGIGNARFTNRQPP